MIVMARGGRKRIEKAGIGDRKPGCVVLSPYGHVDRQVSAISY
jgi:hypothetical protein